MLDNNLRCLIELMTYLEGEWSTNSVRACLCIIIFLLLYFHGNVSNLLKTQEYLLIWKGEHVLLMHTNLIQSKQ
jgi:hypothetical protein